MSPRQESLLQEDVREASPDAIKKELGKVTRALTALAKASKTDSGRVFSARKKVVAVLRDLDTKLEGWLRYLDGKQAAHVQRHEDALARRREDLAQSAKEFGWSCLRRQDYDVVDCFQVSCKKDRVTVKLGSEKLDAFDEVDGKRLFSRLRAAREALDGFPFDRNEFFRMLKDAIGMAKVLEKDRDGRVPIRVLYPLVVLVRQTRNERFLKKPDSRTYADYPMTQFIYDFARFGRDGWEERGERIANQPPNMITITRGATVTLPVLDGRGAAGPDGAQLSLIQIQRRRSA